MSSSSEMSARRVRMIAATTTDPMLSATGSRVSIRIGTGAGPILNWRWPRQEEVVAETKAHRYPQALRGCRGSSGGTKGRLPLPAASPQFSRVFKL